MKIYSHLAGDEKRLDQGMAGPRVPISITHKRQGRLAIEETLFLARPLDWSANVKGAALLGHNSLSQPRQYLLMTEYTNTGDEPVEDIPVLELQGTASGLSVEDDTMFEVALNTYCRTTLALA